MTIPYEARVEVSYDYQSTTSKFVTLLPTHELIALQNAGRTLPSELKSQSSSPISIDIQVKGPIRTISGKVEFPVTFKISNVGGGIVEGGKISSFFVEGKGGLSDSGCDKSEFDLWRGQSQTITCKMSATGVTKLTQARIEVTAEYGYIISSAAKISVIGN
jgi:hypothetical protein